MNIVIPMAGSQRGFLRSKFRQPRYAININGVSVLQRSLRGVDQGKHRLFFVCSQAHCDRYHTHEMILRQFVDATVIVVSGKTKGQACTALCTGEKAATDDPLIILSPDQVVDWSFDNYLRYVETMDCDASMITTTDVAIGKSRFYASCDEEHGYVNRVCESYARESLHDCGIYYFKYGWFFWRWAELMMKHNHYHQGEFWAGLAMNYAVSEGHLVVPYLADSAVFLNNAECVRQFASENLRWTRY